MTFFLNRHLSPVALSVAALCSVVFAPLTALAASPAPPKFLHSVDFSEGKVRGYLVSASTGAIKPTGQIPPWAHRGPTRVVSDKGGYRLYVINHGSKDVNAYFINRHNVTSPLFPARLLGQLMRAPMAMVQQT